MLNEQSSSDERFASNDWQKGPRAGQRYFRPNSFGKHSAETRHVVDRTFGGDVVYISGRRTPYAQKITENSEKWNCWVIEAKLIS